MARKRLTDVEGVYIVKAARPGKPVRWYIYAWRGGPQIRVHAGLERPAITKADVTAIAQALEEAKPSNQDTVRGLVASYRSDENPEWRTLADSTKKLWGRCLDAIIEKWGDSALSFWNNPRTVAKVMSWRDSMAANPRKADNHISTLFRLLEYGRLRTRVTINVAAGIPTIYKGGQRAEIIWTDTDLEIFLKQAKTPIADAVRLATMTGLRRQDLVALTWDEIGQWAIRRTAIKKSKGKRRKVVMPIVPGLKELLDELKTRRRVDGVKTVLVNGFGEAWTGDGLNSTFHDTRGLCVGADKKPLLTHTDDDGKVHWLRLHDLRGTFATKLMTIPGERLTDREIADVMGWSEKQVAEIRRRYVDDAAIVVALGKRLANTIAKPIAKRPDEG